jgi:hypothetical protein
MEPAHQNLLIKGLLGLLGLSAVSISFFSVSAPGSVSGSLVELNGIKTEFVVEPRERPGDGELIQQLDREYYLLLAQERRFEGQR